MFRSTFVPKVLCSELLQNRFDGDTAPPNRHFTFGMATFQILQIFKQPKTHDEGFDFDDFWTKWIVSTRSMLSKISRRQKIYRTDRKFSRCAAAAVAVAVVVVVVD